ncbi:MAG: FAD:protein FMN transferase [Gemmatimonadetes bacterium]|nr:FAD:protein FMN transferase [Gemmatimonadota bacterium]
MPDDSGERLRPLRLATAAMGTRFELVLGGEDHDRLRPVGEAAIEIIEECHRRLSRFAPDSLVSHINRTAHARPVRLDTDTFAMIREALTVRDASDGAFDITVASFMDGLLGRGSGTAGARACVNDSVRLDAPDSTIRFAHEGTAIDLGGIAKGHALDLAARVLREHGVTCALLHGGTSSIVGIGAPPGSDGWCIALDRIAGAPTLRLRDAALSVSAPAGPRSRAIHSTSIGHIVDPRTGEPVPAARRAAVAGPSARLADAWATAIVVLGHRPPGLGAEWSIRWLDS